MFLLNLTDKKFEIIKHFNVEKYSRIKFKTTIETYIETSQRFDQQWYIFINNNLPYRMICGHFRYILLPIENLWNFNQHFNGKKCVCWEMNGIYYYFVTCVR